MQKQVAVGHVAHHKGHAIGLLALRRGLAQQRAGARRGVLQVGRRVALERQHLVEGKDDVALRVVGQVGVLDGTEADDGTEFVEFGIGPGLVALGASLYLRRTSSPLGLIQQLVEADHIALPGAESPLRQRHHAEPEVLQLHVHVPHLSGRRKELAKVQLLAKVGDVDDALRLELPQPQLDGSEVGGRIQRGAILLANQEWRHLVFTVGIAEEHAHCTLGVLCNALFEQPLDQRDELVVVVALSIGLIEVHIEALVDGIKRRLG